MDQCNYIEIQLVKCVIFLTPAEVNQLLQKDPELFAQALKRGKGILRVRADRERQAEGKIYKR